MKFCAKIASYALIFAFFIGILPVGAYTIENIPETRVDNDFVVGPGKTEVRMDPGETSIKSITVTNRFGKEMKFDLGIEDFAPTGDPNDIMKLMGDEKGPYSLRDYIKPDVSSVVLQQGDRVRIPVTISIPNDATPGDLYGAIIVTFEPTDPLEKEAFDEAAKSGVSIQSRIASLFFVRVNGPVKEEGELTSFSTDKKFQTKGPINFNYEYKNTGSVYVTPYGVIEVKNIYGTVVDTVSLSPFFALPSGSRIMHKQWDRGFLMGRYKATISLNRGYGDKVDEKTIVFWVLPWKVIVAILAGLFILIAVIYWIGKNYEVKKKRRDQPKN